MSPDLILIDGHYLLHRALHLPDFVSMKTSKGQPTGGAFSVILAIKKTLERFPTAERCVVAWDTGRSRRRKEIFPEYKANRDPSTPEEVEEKRQYKELFDSQLALLQSSLPRLGVRQILLNHYEGDDLIAYSCKKYEGEKKILIVSEDKDLLQLVNENVAMWMIRKDTLVTSENFLDEVGIERRLYLLYKALLGDPSDNIPGIPGVGPGTLKPIFSTAAGIAVTLSGEDLRENYHDLLNEACEAQPLLKSGKMSTRVARVLDSLDVLDRNLEVMDLALDHPNEAEAEILRIMTEEGLFFITQKDALDLLCGMEFESIIENFSYLYNALRALR